MCWVLRRFFEKRLLGVSGVRPDYSWFPSLKFTFDKVFCFADFVISKMFSNCLAICSKLLLEIAN